MFVWSGTDSSRLCLFGVVPIHLDYVCLEWYRFISTMFVWSGTVSLSSMFVWSGTVSLSTMFVWSGTDSLSTMFVLSGTDSSRLCWFGVVPIRLDYVCLEWYRFSLDYVCLEWYRFVSTMFVLSGTDSSRLCLF
jgi:hypothetical protein